MEGKLRHAQRERALAELATRQHGVASHVQLRELGFGERWIERRLEEGRLQAVHRSVYAVGHSRLTRRSGWWAAVLAYGPGALLSHRTAAVLWGFQRPRREPIHVTAGCGHQGIQRREGIWIHRCRLAQVDRATRDGFPVTTVARTLFDFAEVAPFESLKGAAEEADRLKLLRLRELEEVCERGRGRRALRPVRRLLAELGVPDEGRSPLEIRFPAFVREHRLPPPVQNVHVLGHEVDAPGSTEIRLPSLNTPLRRDWRNPRARSGERRTKRGKDAGRPNSSAIWPTEDAAPRSVRRRQARAGISPSPPT